MLAVLPFVGLVMGPVAVLLGLVAMYRCRGGRAPLGVKLGRVTIIFGMVVSLFHWVGFWLMRMG